jgi:integrase
VTKTDGSAATIGVDLSVIQRVQSLKALEVEIKWGGKGAKKKIKLVRSAEPTDLVFQSLRKGAPMSDQNILRRHLRPVAAKLGIDTQKVTWRALRRSYGTWMAEAGANPKDIQAQMRHSRISTTFDLYTQFVPESQRRGVAKMMDMVAERKAKMLSQESAVVN